MRLELKPLFLNLLELLTWTPTPHFCVFAYKNPVSFTRDNRTCGHHYENIFPHLCDCTESSSSRGLPSFCDSHHCFYVLQDQTTSPNVPRVPVSVPGAGVGAQAPNVTMAGNHSNQSYLSNQQQAAVMKQHQMLMDQQKQREQQQKHLLMEQQKQQFLMEQRQQHLLVEQVRGASNLLSSFPLACFGWLKAVFEM